VQFHRSITRREFEEHGALDLKREGKVRFIGVSETLPNLDEQIGMGVFDPFDDLHDVEIDVLLRRTRNPALCTFPTVSRFRSGPIRLESGVIKSLHPSRASFPSLPETYWSSFDRCSGRREANSNVP